MSIKMQLVDCNNQMIKNRLSIDLINGINPKHVKENNSLYVINEVNSDEKGKEVAFLTWKPSKLRITSTIGKKITVEQEYLENKPEYSKTPNFYNDKGNKGEKRYEQFINSLKNKPYKTAVEFSLNGKDWNDSIDVIFDDFNKIKQKFYKDIYVRGKYQKDNLHQGASPFRPDIKISAKNVKKEDQESLYIMIRTRRNANELCDQAIEQYTSAFYALNTHQLDEHKKLKFIGAGKGIYCTDFVEMHVKAAETSAHNDTHFLPWHRMYLLDIERHLQMYNPFVTLNYWKFDEPAPRLFTEHFIGETQVTDGVDGKQHEIAYFDQGGSSTNLVKFSNKNPLRAWTLNGRIGIQREARFNPTIDTPTGLPGGLNHYDDEAVYLLGDRLGVPFIKINPEVYGKINEDRQNTEKAYFIQQLGKCLEYSSRLNQVIVDRVSNFNIDTTTIYDIEIVRKQLNAIAVEIKNQFEEIKQEDCNIIFSYVDDVVVRIESIINDLKIDEIEKLISKLKEFIDSLNSNYEIFESIKIYPQLITSYNRMHKFITQDGDLRPETFSEFVRRELIFQRDISVNSFEAMEIFTHSSAHVSFNGYLNMVPIAPQDPIFFLLHTNVDRQWAEWQKRKGTYMVSDPASYPYQLPECLPFDETQINPAFTKVDEWKTIDAPLWPWHDVASHPGSKLPPGTRKRNFAHSKFGKNFEHNVPHIYDAINGFGYPYNSTNGIVVHEDYLGFEYDSIEFLDRQKNEVDLKRVKFLKLNQAATELVKRYKINTDTAGVFNFAGSIFSIYERHPLIKNYDDLIEIMLEEIITFKLNDKTEFEFIDNIANNTDFKKLTSSEFEELAKDKAGLAKIKKSLNSEIKGYIELVSASTIFLELNPKVYRQFQQMLMLLSDDAVQKDLRTIAYSALVNFFEHLPMIARLQDKLDNYVNDILVINEIKDIISDHLKNSKNEIIIDFINNSRKIKNIKELFILIYNFAQNQYEVLFNKIVLKLAKIPNFEELLLPDNDAKLKIVLDEIFKTDIGQKLESLVTVDFIIELIKEIIIEENQKEEETPDDNLIGVTSNNNILFKDSSPKRKEINDLLFSDNEELPVDLIINLLGIKNGRLDTNYLKVIIEKSKNLKGILASIKHLPLEEFDNKSIIKVKNILENEELIDSAKYKEIINANIECTFIKNLVLDLVIARNKFKKSKVKTLRASMDKLVFTTNRNDAKYQQDLNLYLSSFRQNFIEFKDDYTKTLKDFNYSNKYFINYYKNSYSDSLYAIEKIENYLDQSDKLGFSITYDSLSKYVNILDLSIQYYAKYDSLFDLIYTVLFNKNESRDCILMQKENIKAEVVKNKPALV